MDKLIKIESKEINDENTPTVNARDLYEFLGVGTRFNDWITVRTEECLFLENKDFCIFTEKKVKIDGDGAEVISKGRPTKEYYITLEMAKHLAMMERNDRGRQIRDYFIECEKKLRQNLKPLTPMEMINVMSSEVIKLQKQVDNQENRLNNIETNLLEKADLADRLSDSALLLSSTQMGSIFGLSARAFNEKLKEHKIAYKTTYRDEKGVDRTHYVFYADYKDNGLGKTVLWNNKSGAFGTCLKFYPSSVPFFERVYGIKANRQVLAAILLNK